MKDFYSSMHQNSEYSFFFFSFFFFFFVVSFWWYIAFGCISFLFFLFFIIHCTISLCRSSFVVLLACIIWKEIQRTKRQLREYENHFFFFFLTKNSEFSFVSNELQHTMGRIKRKFSRRFGCIGRPLTLSSVCKIYCNFINNVPRRRHFETNETFWAEMYARKKKKHDCLVRTENSFLRDHYSASPGKASRC